MVSPRRLCARPGVIALVTLAVTSVAFPRTAEARRNGYFGNCAQCHKDVEGGTVALTLNPDQWEPGQLVRVTVEVSGDGNSAGFFLNAAGVGELIPVDGETRVNGTQATHTGPKGMNGSTSFEIDWQAPNEPRAVHFSVYGVISNGNNNASGDGTAGPVLVDRLFGCEGSTFYRDFDSDGYGTSLVAPQVDCSAPPGYAPLGGDCSEDDAMLNPGMTETCNAIDDDCDGRVDEFAAPTCGIGLCLRYAEFCDENAPCFPGDPMPEMCNGLDDDCDGLVDQGGLCMDDLVCHAAECKTLDAALAVDPDFVPFEGSEPTPEPTGGSGGMTAIPTGGSGGTPTTPMNPPPMGGTTGAVSGGSGGAAPMSSPTPVASGQGSCGLARAPLSSAWPSLTLLAALLVARRRARR